MTYIRKEGDQHPKPKIVEIITPNLKFNTWLILIP